MGCCASNEYQQVVNYEGYGSSQTNATLELGKVLKFHGANIVVRKSHDGVFYATDGNIKVIHFEEQNGVTKAWI